MSRPSCSGFCGRPRKRPVVARCLPDGASEVRFDEILAPRDGAHLVAFFYERVSFGEPCLKRGGMGKELAIVDVHALSVQVTARQRELHGRLLCRGVALEKVGVVIEPRGKAANGVDKCLGDPARAAQRLFAHARSFTVRIGAPLVSPPLLVAGRVAALVERFWLFVLPASVLKRVGLRGVRIFGSAEANGSSTGRLTSSP